MSSPTVDITNFGINQTSQLYSWSALGSLPLKGRIVIGRHCLESPGVGPTHLARYRDPECGIILGADRNNMDIKPILSCGLRLRQVVGLSMRQGAILDIIIMNLSSYFKTPVIAPPLQPDDPIQRKTK